MFFLTKPDAAAVRDYIESQRHTNLTYDDVGSTMNPHAVHAGGFNVDHNSILLGRGQNIFEEAKLALSAWKMFDVGWVEPLVEAPELALRIRHLGFWSLNSARIVYTFDEPRQFGFAYGTLEDHSECGEERFAVVHREDDTVWYEIYAFSRPRHILARIAKPVARMLQKRFVRDSLQAMHRAVG